MIKLYQPEFSKEELSSVGKLFKSGQLSYGEAVEKFEKEFANFIGAKYAVAVNSCSSALFLSLLRRRDKIKSRIVVLPSVTHMSAINSIINADLKPVFEDKVYVGSEYELKGSKVWDSAHWIERGMYKKGSLMCFSFYPTKILGAAEGGAIATDSKRDYEWLKRAGMQGIKYSGSTWDYKVMMPGWKMHMTNIQAVILLHRLKRLDEYNDRRRMVRDEYNKWFMQDIKALHVYPIFVSNRKDAIAELDKVGIQTSVHFKPLHLHPAYKNYTTDLRNSKWWGSHELSLPIHENMSYHDVKKVITEVRKHANIIQGV